MSMQTPAGVDPAATESLRRLILGLADSKRVLGIRYSDWILGAPSVEDGIAASSMAQDEWGHARLIYAMLKEFGEDPVAIEHERAAEEYRSLDALDRPFEDWAEVTVAMVLVDGALTAMLEAFAEGGFDPASGRIPKMVAEEEFHADLGAAWYRRLAAGSEAARSRLRESTMAILPRLLAWIDPTDDIADILSRTGMYRADPAPVSVFIERVKPLLASVEIDPEGVTADREYWDDARGRGPGHPTEETIARARGDLNRALFVE